jgi:hypothetical protein
MARVLAAALAASILFGLLDAGAVQASAGDTSSPSSGFAIRPARERRRRRPQ